MTAAIARMNLALHGVEDFAIVRGDTLERPAFTDRDRLRTFDVVLANPPYSITGQAGFARAVPIADVAVQEYSLSIPLYVKRASNGVSPAEQPRLSELWVTWEQEGRVFWQEMDALVEMLDGLD